MNVVRKTFDQCGQVVEGAVASAFLAYMFAIPIFGMLLTIAAMHDWCNKKDSLTETEKGALTFLAVGAQALVSITLLEWVLRHV